MRRAHLISSVLATVLAAILVAAAPAARAQEVTKAVVLEPPRHRQGYYIGVGQHLLMSQIWEDGDALGVWSGSALTIRAGQLLTRRFGLGLQIDFGGSQKGTETAGVFGLSLTAQFEVFRHLAVHGGFGLGVINIVDSAEPDADLRGAFGTGYFVGASYDWFPWKRRLTGGLALSPMVQARLIPGVEADGLIFIGGLEVAWWTGLPRNQLDLPPSEAFKKQ